MEGVVVVGLADGSVVGPMEGDTVVGFSEGE
jgi:hypothetical protein